MSGLRERQRHLARNAITTAAAELVTERHQLDFSMQEVAERAGVSLRTVYNHFETREDLLDELGRELSRTMAEAGGPAADEMTSPDDLVRAIGINYALFDDMGGISEAFAQMPLAEVGRDAERNERTERLAALLVDGMPSVPEQDARDIALLLRHLFSHRSWFWLTREYGISTDRLTDLTTWAIRTLVDAAERGDGPRLEEA